MAGPDFSTAELSLLVAAAKRQPRIIQFLGHMRQRLDAQRLAFVIGAGVSKPAGGPLWHDLIARLLAYYEDTPTPAPVAPKDWHKNHTSTLLARFIFHRYSERIRGANAKKPKGKTKPDLDMAEVVVLDGWYKKIHEAIYQDVPDDPGEVFKLHPYLRDLAALVLRSRFCLSLNFDDILDRAASIVAAESTVHKRPQSIWSPQVIDRDDGAVIYHLNGFLPREPGATRSESVTLTEDAFAHAAASPQGEESEYLMSRLFSNTVCVLGASLNDPLLRNAFYISARRNPSSFHYCILHDPGVTADNVDKDERYDRFYANKDLYNLITIYLPEDELAAVVKLLALPLDVFKKNLLQLANKTNQEPVRRYFLVGTVSCGKSSAISRLRIFNSHEEWGRPPPAEMYMRDSSLTPAQREKVLEFVLDQLSYKNSWMSEVPFGIAVMDRAPLDLCAFSKDDQENTAKLNELRGRLDGSGLTTGEIVYLEADAAIIERRQFRRGRGDDWLRKKAYKKKEISLQNERLKKVYGIAPEDAIDTSKLGIHQVARKLAEKMLLGDYAPCDLNQRLAAIAGGEPIVGAP